MNSFLIRPLAWFCIFLVNCSLFGADDEAGSEKKQQVGHELIQEGERSISIDTLRNKYEALLKACFSLKQSGDIENLRALLGMMIQARVNLHRALIAAAPNSPMNCHFCLMELVMDFHFFVSHFNGSFNQQRSTATGGSLNSIDSTPSQNTAIWDYKWILERMQKTRLINEEDISVLENFLKEHIANGEGLSLPQLLAIAHTLRSACERLTANQVFQAFTCGDLLTIFFLLQNVANINFLFNRENEHDCTPLHMAAMKGHAKILELLINLYQQGKIPCRYLCAWILSQNAYGNTILHLAIINNHRHIVGLWIDLEIAGRLPEELLLNLLQIHDAHGNNILHFAADQNQAVFLQELLIFVQQGRLSPKIVSLLLILLNKRNAFFCTPLEIVPKDTITSLLISELIHYCSMTSCSSSKFQPDHKEDPDDDSQNGSFNAPSIASNHPSFLVESNIQTQDKQSSGQGSAQEATAKKMATLADFTKLSISEDRNSYARLVHRLSSF